MIVGVRASIESHIRPIVPSAADGRVVVAKVPAIHVVISGINKTVLSPIQCLASVRIKEVAPRMSHECLRTKGCDFIDTQTSIKTA